MAEQPLSEKPPEYDSVVLEPPCYDDAIKLSPSTLLQSKPYKDGMLPNYNDLDMNGSMNGSTNAFTVITIVQSSSDATVGNDDASETAKSADGSGSSGLR